MAWIRKEQQNLCQNFVKWKRLTRTKLETRPSSCDHDLKEEGGIDKGKPAACLALRKELKSAVQNLTEEIAPVCSMYDLDF